MCIKMKIIIMPNSQSSDQSHRPTKHICLKNQHVFEIKKIKNKLLITLWFKLIRWPIQNFKPAIIIIIKWMIYNLALDAIIIIKQANLNNKDKNKDGITKINNKYSTNY